MGILSEVTEIPRKTMILFFLLDTSGSMEGTKIATLNDAMREIIPDIKEISDSNADALIKIAAIDFASGTEWITPFPQELDSFRWQNLEAGGLTDLGAACYELNAKLDRNSFLQDRVGNYAPVIILLSDGAPTDDYAGGLAALKQNKWFGAAIKIALAVGSDADVDCLAEFTGNKELVIPVMGKAMMKRMIRFVSVTSSKIGSKKAVDVSFDDGFGGGGAAAMAAFQSKEAELVQAVRYEMANIDPEESIDEGW